MKKLYIQNKNYSGDFLYNKLPKLVLKLLLSEMAKKKYEYAFIALNEKYEVNMKEVLDCISKNIITRELEDMTLVYINDTAKLNNKVSLKSIIGFLDSGDLDTHGTLIFSKIFEYVNNNLNLLYKLSVVKGGSSLWR